MRLRAAVVSDRGLIRPANEDSFFLRRGLYAVCDGMGGARAGEVASQMACLGLLALDPASAGKKELHTAITNTNQAIISRSIAEEHLLGMGTTLTAVLVKEGALILAHVGDSRAYLFHDGSLIQLSDDHSWVGEMVRRGELTPAQAAVHPHRSVITRALGTDSDLEPDLTEVDIGEGDRILLCSDGLSGFVSEADIAATLEEGEPPQETAEMLVRAALAGGGEDNVTVVVIDVLAEDTEAGNGTAGDQVGERILIGPSDRGVATAGPGSRTRKAGAAVRERLTRRSAPSMRPAGGRPADTPGAEERPASDGDGGSPETDASNGTPSDDPAPTEQVGAAAKPAARKRRRWFLLAIGIAMVLILVIGGFAVYNDSVYYVGAYDSTVALYRGLPDSVLGVELSSVVELGSVDYQSLAPYLKGRVDSHDLVSKEDGRAFLEALGEPQ